MSGYKIKQLVGYDPAVELYSHMIYSDLMKSLRYGNSWFKEIDSSTYFKTYCKVIDQLLNRSNSILRLAVLSDDDTVLGWALSELETLHYIFVKKDMRGQGIGKALTPKFNQFSHLTKIGQSIWKKSHPEAKFNPFA